MLQANDGQENIELQGITTLFTPIDVEPICFLILPHLGRIQILLMPLTSNFSIQKRGSSIRIRSISPQRHSRATGASLCSGQGTRSLGSSEPPAVVAAQPATMMLRE